MLTKRLRLAFGLGLALAVLLVAADAWPRFALAMLLTNSGANLSREDERSAERNGLYIIGFVVGSGTALMAVGAGALLYRSAKDRLSSRSSRRTGRPVAHELAPNEGGA